MPDHLRGSKLDILSFEVVSCHLFFLFSGRGRSSVLILLGPGAFFLRCVLAVSLQFSDHGPKPFMMFRPSYMLLSASLRRNDLVIYTLLLSYRTNPPPIIQVEKVCALTMEYESFPYSFRNRFEEPEHTIARTRKLSCSLDIRRRVRAIVL